MWQDFKTFLMRGNVMDMAIGIVIGAAFSAVVKSLVDNVIMPPIGLLLGGVDFSNIMTVLKAGDPAGPYVTLTEAQDAGAVVIAWGVFINAIISFIIVAFVIFLLIRYYNRLQREPEPAPAEPTTKECPYCHMEIPIAAVRCPYCTADLAEVDLTPPQG
jgi:large conductance mechanosensitive channel